MALDRRGELGFESLTRQRLGSRDAHLRPDHRRHAGIRRGGTVGTQVPVLWQRSAPWQRRRATGKDAYGATADGPRSSREAARAYCQLGFRSALLPLLNVLSSEVFRSKMNRSSSPADPAEKTMYRPPGDHEGWRTLVLPVAIGMMS